MDAKSCERDAGHSEAPQVTVRDGGQRGASPIHHGQERFWELGDYNSTCLESIFYARVIIHFARERTQLSEFLGGVNHISQGSRGFPCL